MAALFAFLHHAAAFALVAAVHPARVRTMRRIVHAELAAVVVILLCAALMARGIGML